MVATLEMKEVDEGGTVSTGPLKVLDGIFKSYQEKHKELIFKLQRHPPRVNLAFVGCSSLQMNCTANSSGSLRQVVEK